jgi:hypothetical protein
MRMRRKDSIRLNHEAKGAKHLDRKMLSLTWQVHIGAPGFWHTKQRFFTCKPKNLVRGEQECECECN